MRTFWLHDHSPKHAGYPFLALFGQDHDPAVQVMAGLAGKLFHSIKIWFGLFIALGNEKTAYVGAHPGKGSKKEGA